MGAIPNKFPGGQGRRRSRRHRQVRVGLERRASAQAGLDLSDMFAAMERSELDTLYVIGENPAQSGGRSEACDETAARLEAT